MKLINYSQKFLSVCIEMTINNKNLSFHQSISLSKETLIKKKRKKQMEKKITPKQFLSVWHFIYYQHRRKICTFLNLTELLARNRIKETYSYYFY